MKTGAHLKIVPMGNNVLGVRLEGDARKPEPDHFRVCFPGGEVDIVRCADGSFWAHTVVNHDGMRGHDVFKRAGRFVAGRVDDKDGVIDLPNCNHVALRIEAADAPEST